MVRDVKQGVRGGEGGGERFGKQAKMARLVNIIIRNMAMAI